MSTATVTYFHTVSLRQRYIDALDNALRENRLRAEEHTWLQRPTQPLPAADPDPVRVDRLILNDGNDEPFELSAALLLSHAQTDSPEVYLYTLATGIEVFNDRHTLLAVLRARFAQGGTDALFEYERIDADPFRAQMLAIVDHQVEHTEQLSTQLKSMPSLLDASTASLARQLKKTLPHISVDPKTHLLQLVCDSNGDAEPVLITQTLAQAAFDDCCKVELAEGFQRRFLDARGALASTSDTDLYSQAFADAVAGVGEQYGTLLKAYWEGTWREKRSRRHLAIESFNGSLRRELYCQRHDGTLTADVLNPLLPLLQTVTGDLPTGTTIRCSRLTLKIGNSASHALAGTFVVQPGTDEDQSILWFSPDHKLIAFADLAALTACFTTAQGREQLRPALALADQTVLQNQGQVQLGLERIGAHLFADRIDSIIALQARNLLYVTGLSSASDQVMAMFDDALDVRQLIDPRQLQLTAGRWREEAPFNFGSVWLKPPVVAPVPAPSPGPGSEDSTIMQGQPSTRSEISRVSTSWLEQTRTFELRSKRLRQLDNVLRDYAEQALHLYLCVLTSGPVRVGDIRVRWFESGVVDSSGVETRALPVSETGQLISMELVSLLLECVSGHRPRVLTTGTQVLLDSTTAAGLDQIDLINHMLDKLTTNFTEKYVSSFRQARIGYVRQGDRHSQPAREALSLREDALRLDLALRKRQAWVNSAAVGMVRQVLDRPVGSLRMALDVPATEVFSVALSYDDNPGVVLCDAMVLRQPLNPTGPVMLWCCALGWRQFASVERLEAMLQRELHQTYPERWLELLGERDRTLLRNHLLKPSDNQVRIRLDRIDGHAIEALQERALNREQQDLRQLCLRAARCRFEAGLFTQLASATELDGQLDNMLDGLSVRIDNSLFEALMPPWVRSASIADLKLYLHIWTRYFLSTDGGKDFLFDIPSLGDYACEQLTKQLAKDFPGQLLDPDKITITSRRYVTASPAAGELPSGVAAATIVHSESLTDFSVNRFVDDQGAILSVDSAEQPQSVRLLTPVYLRQLVRSVDVGTRFMALLTKKLAPDDADYVLRKSLFVAQTPPMLLALALPEKLKGNLSQKAYNFISRVLDMPDGLAREPVDGTRVIISALQLVADAGMSPDTVTGVYLICPADPDAGPVVLYVAQHPVFTFREYTSQSALMDDVRNDESLQQLLLERLDPEVTRRYAHGGFAEPHLPFSVEGFNEIPLSTPGPVTLELTEVKGNALQFLFTGTVKLLLDLGVSNVVTNEQADRSDRTFLATLGLEQAMTLLPGKLAALLGLWQSHTLFRASAASVSGRRWGQALSEFSAALAVMITVREQAIEDLPLEEQVSTGSPLATGEQDRSPTAFSWEEGALNAEQRMRLQGLEAKSVALHEMRHDDLLNLYLDKASGTPYAVVAGKVYQVKSKPLQGVWIIVGADGTPGPMIKLDENQRWQLDLTLRLRGGGGIITKDASASADTLADDVLIIEARGMPEIRLLYRDHARRIGQAHLQAKRYLENCLDNLNVHQRGAALDPRVKQIIGEFFGVSRPDQALLIQVESTIKTLFDEVMDASLAPFSSPRFIVGNNRPGREAVNAFVIKGDPKKRVFLTEQFFTVPPFALKPLAAAQGFDFPDHYRAATLLHELSHQALATYDIAYLEAMAPFPDLLLEDNADHVRLRAEVERLQESRLSHRTSKSALFTHFENGQWRDLTHHDRRGVELILRITGTYDLDDARDIFLADAKKRSQILLSNADSVTLLILRLGRRNFVVPGP